MSEENPLIGIAKTNEQILRDLIAEGHVFTVYPMRKEEPVKVKHEPIGYVCTVRELIQKLIGYDGDAKLYMSGDDYFGGATLMDGDYNEILRAEGL